VTFVARIVFVAEALRGYRGLRSRDHIKFALGTRFDLARAHGAAQEDDMQLEQRIAGDVVIVKVTGEITLNKGGDVLLKDKIQSLLQQGHRKMVLDLGAVSYVDSAGLGQLVQIHATAAHSGGAMKLLNLTKRLKDLLVVTKLLTVFDAYDNEAEALASFVKPANV
jgi:anti-sigma B factor antagonist